MKSPGTAGVSPAPVDSGGADVSSAPASGGMSAGRAATRRPCGDGGPTPLDAGADETSALPVGVADFSQTLTDLRRRAHMVARLWYNDGGDRSFGGHHDAHRRLYRGARGKLRLGRLCQTSASAEAASGQRCDGRRTKNPTASAVWNVKLSCVWRGRIVAECGCLENS